MAKVSRDLEMQQLDQLYPGYGFAVHMGYPTRAHLQALALQGYHPSTAAVSVRSGNNSPLTVPAVLLTGG
ncbi:MAG: hypothetical protein R3E95_14075 [Thiolinea sp.]